MEKGIKTVIAGIDLANLNSDGDFVILGRTDSGEEAVRMVESMKPDLLVTSLLLRDCDGLEVLERVRENEGAPARALLSTFPSQLIMGVTGQLGASYITVRPDETKEAANSLRALAAVRGPEPEPEAEDGEIRRRAEELMYAAGFPVNLAGYRQLREAIVLAATRPDTLNAMTKELYPTVAQRMGSTSQRVERDIRIIISSVWKHNPEGIARILGPSMRGRPTNSHLIASAAYELTRRERAVL